MPSPNDEFQQYADEYADQRFNKSIRRLFSIQMLMLVAFLIFYSISFSNTLFHVYPSTLGVAVALMICCLLAVSLTVWFTSRTVRKAAPNTNSSSSMDITMGILGATLLAPIAFNICLGCLIAVTGAPGERQATEDLWRDHYFGPYSSGCAGPVIQDVWYDSDIVCLDPHRQHEFPKGSHITLKGKTSPLGMNVEDAVPHW